VMGAPTPPKFVPADPRLTSVTSPAPGIWFGVGAALIAADTTKATATTSGFTTNGDFLIKLRTSTSP
jgi:hypothetical protein